MTPAAVLDTPAMAALDNEVGKAPAGVVLPPKNIRDVLERTAGYVARNGRIFEDRIRQKESHNSKFSFLSENDPYHPYYTWRLSEILEGRGTAIAAGRADEVAAPIEEKPKGPAEPPPFHFSARMPNISAQDLEIVRLTALFVAKNGRSFMTALSQRESGNYQFDFLRPQHSLYQFFSRLVDQYTELLTGGSVDGGKPEKARIAELQHNVQDRFHTLQRARQRAEWVKYQQQQKQQKEEEAEKEKLEFQQIDWHDFVVVETVLFTEADDATELPAPTSLADLQSASLEQKAMMSLQPHNMRIEEAMPTDDMYYAQPDAQQYQSPAPQAPFIPPPGQSEQMDYPMRNADEEDEDEARIRERMAERERAQQAQAAARGGTGPMRIRSDYVPRAQARKKNVQMALCPNCKQQIPFDELEQHMRIELLDPQWKEQAAKAAARYSTTNLSTSDVANNLKRLASQRSDVFDGVTGQPISEEEQARRKKAATSYDGQPESKDAARLQMMQGMNIEEQIRQIHQKHGK
ncbi:Pre-mRNA splicing factor PRP21 like protein-domain-containing protein [Cryomyces antarcticus]